jgi:hypothetical protein
MEEWSKSEYGDHFRMINSETLKPLQRYWRLYSDPTEDFYPLFEAGIKNARETTYGGDGTGGFCHAAGMHVALIQLMDPEGEWALTGCDIGKRDRGSSSR